MSNRLSEACQVYLIGLLDKLNFNNSRSARWSYRDDGVEYFSDGSLKLIIQGQSHTKFLMFMANWTLGLSDQFYIEFFDLEQDMKRLKAAYTHVLNNA